MPLNCSKAEGKDCRARGAGTPGLPEPLRAPSPNSRSTPQASRREAVGKTRPLGGAGAATSSYAANLATQRERGRGASSWESKRLSTGETRQASNQPLTSRPACHFDPRRTHDLLGKSQKTSWVQCASTLRHVRRLGRMPAQAQFWRPTQLPVTSLRRGRPGGAGWIFCVLGFKKHFPWCDRKNGRQGIRPPVFSLGSITDELWELEQY